MDGEGVALDGGDRAVAAMDIRRVDHAVFFEAGLGPGALEVLQVVHGSSLRLVAGVLSPLKRLPQKASPLKPLPQKLAPAKSWLLQKVGSHIRRGSPCVGAASAAMLWRWISRCGWSPRARPPTRRGRGSRP